MAKNIWIINEHLSSPDLSALGHSRHYTLGLEFIKKGYDVTLITSSFSHNPMRKVGLRGLFKVLNGKVRTLVLKGFFYEKTNSPIRIINWILFSLLFFLAPFTKLPKPNIIILSSTPMLPVYNVLLFRKIYPNCKFIFETRDLWPLTPISIGGYSRKSLFIKFLAHLEYKCYSKADYIVSVLKNSDKHVENILGEIKFKFKWISNGIDLKGFNKHQRNINWDFLGNIDRPNSFVVGYAGTLGKANAMDYIIETFNRYFVNTNFYLVIVGDGADKEKLKLKAEGNMNIIFIDPVKRDFLMSFYNNCDVLYLGSRNSDLYKYGVSANKIFEYMFAKKPILMSGNIPDNVIELANCGFMVPPENSCAIKDKILEIQSYSDIVKLEIGVRGYTYLIENLTYEKLANDYIAVFQEI